MVSFLEWLTNWEQIGVFNVLMPFLLVFTLTFAILRKVKILGDHKAVDLVVSLVLALLFVRNQALVTLLNQFLPNISIFMVVILMFLLLIGLWSGDQYRGVQNTLLGVAALVSLLFVLWAIFSNMAGSWFNFLPDWIRYMDGDTKAMIIFIGLFVLLIFWLSKGETGGGGEGAPAERDGWFKEFGKGFKRKGVDE